MRGARVLVVAAFASGCSVFAGDLAAGDRPDSGADGSVEAKDEGARRAPDSDAPSSPAPGAPSATDALSARWLSFIDQRNESLERLSTPIVACVQRSDTRDENAAFYGCIDWHSAVHGTWALLVISRLTNNGSYAKISEGILSPESVAKELDSLQRNQHPEEIPYGYAWLLRLAAEHRKTDAQRLDGIAKFAASELKKWISALSSSAVSAAIRKTDYGNLSWALLNLWQYAVATSDSDLQQFVAQYTKAQLLPRDSECPLAGDAFNEFAGFFPACLHRARTLLAVLSAPEARAWASSFAPDELDLPPVASPVTAHHAGLNFSRTWGLYSLYRVTGKPRYQHLYLDHMQAWLPREDVWNGNYRSYSHWVAQFGVYGLALTADEPLAF